MSLKSMGQNAMELVRREGLRAVPHYAYTKFRIFQTRDAQQAHSAARARNEAGYNAWLMAQQPDAAIGVSQISASSVAPAKRS